MSKTVDFDFSKICFGQVSYSMLIEEFWVKFEGMNVFKIWKLKLIFF